jgi:hypothetical protein
MDVLEHGSFSALGSQFFGAIDHDLDEVVGWHTAKLGDRSAEHSALDHPLAVESLWKPRTSRAIPSGCSRCGRRPA